MASAANIDDLLQCPICLEIFYYPKVLDCQHTFCADCLKVYLSSPNTSRLVNAIDCPICRQRSNLINNSIDSLPGNYIVRDIIERKYGNAALQRSNDYNQRIQDRLKNLETSNDEKKNETNFSDYIKSAAAGLVGVLSGLLLAKGVKKLCENKEKSNEE